MTPDLFLIFFWAHLILFLLCFFLIPRLFRNQAWYHQTGKKLLVVKERQLETNPLLKRFAKAVDEGSIMNARLIIASLILFKSLGMAVIGVVGATLFLIPIQAVMMASISEQMKLRGTPQESLSSVTGFQLATMLMAGAMGNLIGWRVFMDQLSLTNALETEFYMILVAGLAVLLTCWITATKEERFYEANKTLIG